MVKWWNWVLAFSLFCLLFVAIPLTLTREKSAEELKPIFDDYIKKFNKTYKDKPDEYLTRFNHFVASVREIDILNSDSYGPDHYKARYGLTKLSDMSKTEFQEIHLSDEQIHKRVERRKHLRNRDSVKVESLNKSSYIFTRKKRLVLPLQVDWRAKGVIGPVRDQGMCGACWAFSTVGTMEAMSAIKTGVLETLSVQEAIDCAGLGNSGCDGGDICLLLDWLLLTATPVEKDKDYPLKLADSTCKAKKNATGVRVAAFTCNDFVDSEDKILQSIALHGPVTVAVNALTWQNYLGGIIQFHCSGAITDLNHAVELVGYDLSAEVPYYIAKNSWGKDFGNAGYVNLAIGTNVCGLANEVASVDVK